MKYRVLSNNQFETKMRRKIHKNIKKNLTALEINALNTTEINK